ncbi:DUF5682 family protein [Myceligenerans crystallogenes]|uniref:DUF5682 family protein n=1 Tax=Myceligenerans crystallogenes TaxID=316335 RepID=UPI0031CEA56D
MTGSGTTTAPGGPPGTMTAGGAAGSGEAGQHGLREVWDLAPGRLRRAAAAVEALRGRGVYLAPVRHHSPACAVAVRRAVEEIRPATVLIEGPEEYTRLLPELLHEETVPPVALLSLPQPAEGRGDGASFYPLAAFSPEWVAIRAAHAIGADIRFCDRPAGERAAAESAEAAGGTPGTSEPGTGEPAAGGPAAGADPEDAGTNPGGSRPADARPGGAGPDTAPEHDPFARTLMSERYLAHSETVAALARRLGCRDHDEVWDHLFEARTPDRLADWRGTFDDVFAWAALSRLDYEDEVLAADGSLEREARMSARVAEASENGTVLVVTGAFHTLAIAEALADLPEGGPVRERRPEGGYGPLAEGDAWLIRYDHERLDGLRGYGAGMPSPGFYERLHAAHERRFAPAERKPGSGPAGARAAKRRKAAAVVPVPPSAGDSRTLVTAVLVDVARAAAEREHQVSTPQVASAAEAAARLADLRMRPVPGRTDVLDAITSCFVTDDGGIGPERPLGLAIAEVFGGRAVGRVPAGAAVPPLVRDARERVRAVGLDIDTTLPRTARLDARRTPSHRARRQVLALLDLLDCGFGRQLSGPDHVGGRGLGLIAEEWEYCWTPVVEARLVELSHLGASVEAAAVTLLRQAEEELRSAGASAAADGAAKLVARAAVVGLTAHLPRLVTLLARTLDTDRDLASVTSGARRLLGLWRSRVELDLDTVPVRPGAGGGTTADAGFPPGRTPADELLSLVGQALATSAYLVSDAGRAGPDDEEAAISTVLELRALVRDAQRAWREAEAGGETAGATGDRVPGSAGGAPRASAAPAGGSSGVTVAAIGGGTGTRVAQDPAASVARELVRLRDDDDAAPGVRGALLAVGSVDGEVPDDLLVARVRGALRPGADPALAVRFLGGVLRAAPDLLIYTPELFDAVDGAIRDLEPEAFLAVLPDLRRGFTWLKPTETHKIAERVAERTGRRASDVDVRVRVDEKDLAAGLAAERELAAVLARDGLAHWSGGTP